MGKRQRRRERDNMIVPAERAENAVPQRPPVTPQQTQQTTTKVFRQLQAFAGPLPPPGLLEHYERVCPGLANRIATQFEEQGRHRRQLENRVVWHNILSSSAGQILAFVIMAGTITAGTWLILHDKPVGGLGAIVTAIGGAAWVVRKAERSRKKELQKKDKNAE